MGNNNEKIQYECGSKYIGQVLNNQPHGKGVLNIHKKSTLFNPKINTDKDDFNVIEGQFQNGNLKKVSMSFKNSFKYAGTLPDKNGNQEGKLIDNQNIQYEGTFLKGKLQKGKITSLTKDNQNMISYICQTQGQFIGTSIINGQGVFYNINEKYIASGEFYKGKLLKGIYLYQNGDRYEGQLSQGMMNGKGIYRTGNCIIENDKKSDEKVLSQVKYEKELLKNVRKQNNTIEFCYDGQFEVNQPAGKGLVKFSNNHSYKGKFKHGRFQGQGEYKFSDGTVYKGSFYGGEMNGDCTIEFTLQSKININKQKFQILQKYQGEVSNGIFHGLGILYYQNGVIFKGYFLNGAKNGPGVLIYCENKFKCLYVMNKLVGELKPIIDQ